MAHNSIVLLLLLELQCSVLQCSLWNPEGHGFCCTFWMSVTALTRIRVDSESGAECVRLARLDSQLRTMLLITAAAAAASTPHRVGSDTSNQQSVVANAVVLERCSTRFLPAAACACPAAPGRSICSSHPSGLRSITDDGMGANKMSYRAVAGGRAHGNRFDVSHTQIGTVAASAQAAQPSQPPIPSHTYQAMPYPLPAPAPALAPAPAPTPAPAPAPGSPAPGSPAPAPSSDPERSQEPAPYCRKAACADVTRDKTLGTDHLLVGPVLVYDGRPLDQ